MTFGSACLHAATAGPAKAPATAAVIPKLTMPSTSPLLDRTIPGSCSSWRRISEASRNTISPAAVGRTPRELRSSKTKPSRSSSSPTCWLSAGCATWIAAAAREKLPASTTFTK